MSDPLLPVQKGERHAMTIGPKQDKEEMFKFRPPSSSTIYSFTTMELWSCLVLVNSFSCPPPHPTPPQLPLHHCVISMEGFSHSTQIPKEDQLVRPEFSQSLIFTDVPFRTYKYFLINPSDREDLTK